MALKQGFAVKGDPKEMGRKGGKSAQEKFERGESAPHRFSPGDDLAEKAGKLGAQVRWAKHRERMISQMQEEIAKRRELQYAPAPEKPETRAAYESAKRELRRLKSAEIRAVARGFEAKNVVATDIRAMAETGGAVDPMMESIIKSMASEVKKEEQALKSAAPAIKPVTFDED